VYGVQCRVQGVGVSLVEAVMRVPMEETVNGGVKADRHAFGAHASLDISSWKPAGERESKTQL